MKLKALTQPDVQQWIQEHRNENVYNLALKKSPFADLQMSDLVQQIQAWQIAKKKFPRLFDGKPIVFPPKINLEQTSSANTAAYKTQIIQGKTMVDITGGFGIDSLYFAKTFERVIHIEHHKNLQELAAYNFKILNQTNIESIHADGLAYLTHNQTYGDILYVDPSRRNPNQQKVFLLEDLSPNVLESIESWKMQFSEIWIKLSPMIDLAYLIQHIPFISQIYLIAVKNELKEVLIQIKKNEKAQITAVNLETNHPQISFLWNQTLPNTPYSDLQDYMYEPNVAIQKSGFNDALVQTYAIKKLSPNSQLFTSNQLIADFPGRIFKVYGFIKNPKKELKNKAIQAIHRNFPESLNSLKKKYKFTTDGTNVVIFTQSQNRVLMIDATQM